MSSLKPTLRYQISVEVEERWDHSQEKCHIPNIFDFSSFLQANLMNHFKTCEVEVRECKDLTKWGLAAQGLSGHTKIIQCGNWKNVTDDSHKDVTFSLSSVAQNSGSRNLALVVGHAASSHRVVGGNGDMIPNARIFGKRSSVSAVVPKRPTYSRSRSISRGSRSRESSEEVKDNQSVDVNDGLLIERYPSDEIGPYGVLYVCDGEVADVLHIKVSCLTSEEQFPDIMRNLMQQYRELHSIKDPLALGGCFQVNGSFEGCTLPSKCPDELIGEDWSETWQCDETSVCFTTLIADSHPSRSFEIVHQSTSVLSNDLCYAGRFVRDFLKETVYDVYLSVAEEIHMFKAPAKM